MILRSLISLLACSATTIATTWYVATTGSNTNSGTNILSPYLTIEKGVSSALAGDTILVAAGAFSESVTTDRSGSSGSPITLDGQGVATLTSFLSTHQYITLQNFTMSGKASGWVIFVGRGSHHLTLSNNVVDGDLNDSIDRAIRWDNPEAGEEPWGTNVASDCTIVSNTIQNVMGTTCLEMFGDRNTVYGNFFRDGDAVDWLHVWGRTNLIVGNVFSNSYVSGLSANHPDFVQAFGLNGHGGYNVIIESNLVVHSEGEAQLCMFEGQDCEDLTDYTFRNNIFVGVSAKGTMGFRNISFYNNVFYQCSTNETTGAEVLIYTVITNATYTNFVSNSGHGGQVFNNIFLDCGRSTLKDRGYYSFDTALTNVAADYNYVGKSDYTSVTEDALQRPIGDPGGWVNMQWWEDNGINGGNPLFVSELLGDFNLLVGSPLIGTAYDFSAVFTTDYSGNDRGTNWDIGPLQYGITSYREELPCGDTESVTLDARAIRAYPISEPDRIRIVWPANPYATEIRISRRLYDDEPSQWATWTRLYTNSDPGTVVDAAFYEDTTTGSGTNYEYEVQQTIGEVICGSTTNAPFRTYQYISAGVEIPLVDERGNLVLLLETNIAASISAELTNLVEDLIGFGYKVFQHVVEPTDVDETEWATNVVAIKALVDADYATDTNAQWTLLSVGHVPVPYAGLTSPGSHSEITGAMPADWYYVQFTDALWTDAAVDDTNADFEHHWNIPGDGKFDTSVLTNGPSMRVGRIDFRNMPAYSETETQLITQYLARAHSWRHKEFEVADRMLIITSAIPREAHSVASSMFGYGDHVDLGNWIADAGSSNFLLLSKRGSGSYDGDVQLGDTTDFVGNPIYGVFTEMYGSYYGDWDSAMHSNDFAQAVLADAGYALTMRYCENAYNLDSSAMGLPVGQELYSLAWNREVGSTKCYWYYDNYFGGSFYPHYESLKCYVSLMGDPTLTMNVVEPPSSLTVVTNGTDFELSWTAPSDEDIEGYHVYRAPQVDLNDFTRLTTTVTTDTTYTNSGAATNNFTYMVRTVKLDESVMRSFYSASQGIFADANGEPDTNAPVITNVVSTANSQSTVTVTWSLDESCTNAVYCSEDESWTNSVSSATFTTSPSLQLTDLVASTTYHVYVFSQDAYGNSSTNRADDFTTLAAPADPTITRVSWGQGVTWGKGVEIKGN